MSGTARPIVERLLDWGSRVTKTDMRYLAKGGLWSAFGQLAAAGTAFGLALIMARWAPKAAYGEYKYVLSAMSLIATFSLTGLTTAVFQSIARGHRGALGIGVRTNLRWSAGVFLGALAVAAYHFAHGEVSLAAGMLLGGCVTPFLASFGLYTALLAGERDFGRLALYGDFLTNIIPAITVGAVAYFAPRPLYLLLAYFAANLVAVGLAYWRSVRVYPLSAASTEDASMLSYSKHLSAMGVLSGIATNIDDILLFHLVGPVELALYAFAIAIPEQTKSFFKSLNIMIVARFVDRPAREIKRGMANKMLWLGLATIAVTIVYIFAAPLIYRLLFPRYADAAFYSQIFAVSLLSNIFLPAQSYLSSKEKVREQYLANAGGAVFQIVAVVIGVLWHGLLGLVIARVIVRVVNRLYQQWLYERAVREDIKAEAAVTGR